MTNCFGGYPCQIFKLFVFKFVFNSWPSLFGKTE